MYKRQIITTGNDGAIDAVGTIGSGTWQGTPVADFYVSQDLTISGGTVDSTVIGGTTPAEGTFTSVIANEDIQANGTLSLDRGITFIEDSELNVLDSVTAGIATANKAVVVDGSKNISGIRDLTMSGTISADTLTGSFNGDGSGITCLLYTSPSPRD